MDSPSCRQPVPVVEGSGCWLFVCVTIVSVTEVSICDQILALCHIRMGPIWFRGTLFAQIFEHSMGFYPNISKDYAQILGWWLFWGGHGSPFPCLTVYAYASCTMVKRILGDSASDGRILGLQIQCRVNQQFPLLVKGLKCNGSV